jgi:hypothetical protein
MTRATAIITRALSRVFKTVSLFGFLGSCMLAGMELYKGATLVQALVTIIFWTTIISVIPVIWDRFVRGLDLVKHRRD